jgi:ribokinase
VKVLVLGSMNYDYVYSVDGIVREGETMLACKRDVVIGGKGLNQAIALSRAGVNVFMSGAVGKENGELLIRGLESAGVNTENIKAIDEPSGHAIIQLSNDGANAIIVYQGSNGKITRQMVDEILCDFGEGDYLLLQNEISNIEYAMTEAKRKNMIIVFNPSPVTDTLFTYPLELVDILILNEIEGITLTGLNDDVSYTKLVDALHLRYPHASVVLTVGEKGVLYRDRQGRKQHGAYDVSVVDTTGAGDTFCGYYVACATKGMSIEDALECASKASSLAVERLGTATSIPEMREVLKADLNLKK